MTCVVHTVLKYDGYVCCSKWAFSVLAYFYFHMSTLYLSTAEAVLQKKRDDMEKTPRQQRMGGSRVFHCKEKVDTVKKLFSYNFNLAEKTFFQSIV